MKNRNVLFDRLLFSQYHNIGLFKVKQQQQTKRKLGEGDQLYIGQSLNIRLSYFYWQYFCLGMKNVGRQGTAQKEVW